MKGATVMEEVISGAIVRRYFEKLQDNLAIDVAIIPVGTVPLHRMSFGGETTVSLSFFADYRFSEDFL